MQDAGGEPKVMLRKKRNAEEVQLQQHAVDVSREQSSTSCICLRTDFVASRSVRFGIGYDTGYVKVSSHPATQFGRTLGDILYK